MSEYQYYEFQAIDRPLGTAEQEALRALSTRARITATSFTNHYEWGNFKGDPRDFVERWFDLHLYLTNWGSRRLMMRLPKRFVDRSSLDVFLLDVDWVKVWARGDHLIIDMWREEVGEGYDDWDDGGGWLAALAPLRTDVLSGDLRLFYLLWLTAIEDGALAEHAAEPLAGIGPLTGPLEGAAEFFGIDPDLVEAAAERPESKDDTLSAGAVRGALADMPDDEKTDVLMRVVDGDPRVAAELKRRVRARHPGPATALRKVSELRARAAAIRRERNHVEAEQRETERRRRAEEEERVRRRYLDALGGKGERVWGDIEDEIQRRNAPAYDRAARLLFDLQAIAAEQGTLADFARRVEALREKHARKEKFIERLKGLKTR